MALRKASTCALVATAVVVAAALSAAVAAVAVPAATPPAPVSLRLAGGEPEPGRGPEDLYKERDLCHYGWRRCFKPHPGDSLEYTDSMCHECARVCYYAAGIAEGLVWPKFETNLTADGDACRDAQQPPVLA
eukprot:TRINITY_DN12808_c0_g1_i1.p2 TRINITY_DN12808_c0_g1~~TRINITY_DN12808_c0_g1_i1.p2  ORF type:complete len:142 (-),score=19.76 TRINITY_DN12808_c0_g1_i1:237-632(-)